MHMTPRTAQCEWAQERLRLNQTWKCIAIWFVKILHNVYLACEDSTMCFFLHFNWISSCLFGCFVYWLCCFPFSMSPTVGCIQHSTPQNTYVAEDQPCCPLRPPLSRTSIVPCPSLGILAVSAQDTWVPGRAGTHVSANWHSWAWQTRTYIRTHACTYARIVRE